MGSRLKKVSSVELSRLEAEVKFSVVNIDLRKSIQQDKFI